MKPMDLCFRLVCSFIAISTGSGFYLPGLAPVNFCEEDKKTGDCQVTLSLFSYVLVSQPFCRTDREGSVY